MSPWGGGLNILGKGGTGPHGRGHPWMGWGPPNPPILDNPGTSGGPGGRDREKKKKGPKISFFFVTKYKLLPFLFCIYLLVLPKYWVKKYFAHGRFPEVGSRKTAEKNTFFS